MSEEYIALNIEATGNSEQRFFIQPMGEVQYMGQRKSEFIINGHSIMVEDGDCVSLDEKGVPIISNK